MKYNDYELLYMVRENDEFSSRILLEKYYPIIKNISIEYYNKYKNFGYDLEDFIQEALLAFYKAVDTFNENRNVLFYTYLCVCIHRKFSSFCRRFCSTTKVLSNTYFSSYAGYSLIIIDSASLIGNIPYISSVTNGINGCNIFNIPVKT